MTTLARYTKQFVQYLRNTKAVSALEYAILVGVIAVAVGAALVTFSDDIQTAITGIGDDVATIEVTGMDSPEADTDAD